MDTAGIRGLFVRADQMERRPRTGHFDNGCSITHKRRSSMLGKVDDDRAGQPVSATRQVNNASLRIHGPLQSVGVVMLAIADSATIQNCCHRRVRHGH